MVGLYTDEHGAMPYSVALPEVIDPACEGPAATHDLPCCPVNARLEAGRLVDSGFRTFNWPTETWSSMFAEVTRGKPSGYRPGELPVGLPLAWTSKPVKGTMRYVAILPPESSGDLTLTDTYPLDEEEFQVKMEEVRKALAAIKHRSGGREHRRQGQSQEGDAPENRHGHERR
jgi:hypothetical protein